MLERLIRGRGLAIVLRTLIRSVLARAAARRPDAAVQSRVVFRHYL